MCCLSYHHNGFVATHALEHMMYSYTLLVTKNQRVLNKLSKLSLLVPAMCNLYHVPKKHDKTDV